MNNVIVKEETRNDRQKKTAEVFTPDTLVNEMLNKLPKEVWKENKTFCDPACGNGQFLVNVLLRKLNNKHNPLDALKSVYGADIMRDNIRECRWRLLKLISQYETITEEHIKTVMKNVVWLNIKYYENGSLDYDFSFGNGIKKQDIERWIKNIEAGSLEDIEEELPVIEVLDKRAKDREEEKETLL